MRSMTIEEMLRNIADLKENKDDVAFKEFFNSLSMDEARLLEQFSFVLNAWCKKRIGK